MKKTIIAGILGSCILIAALLSYVCLRQAGQEDHENREYPPVASRLARIGPYGKDISTTEQIGNCIPQARPAGPEPITAIFLLVLFLGF